MVDPYFMFTFTHLRRATRGTGDRCPHPKRTGGHRANGFLLLPFLAAGCMGDDPLKVSLGPEAITISPASATLAAPGETIRLVATVEPQARLTTGADITWASLDASVVSVDASGLVTAAGAGATRITATVGTLTDTATIEVGLVAASQLTCSDVVRSDGRGLVWLYWYTDGWNWTNNTNWVTVNPLDTWYGVTTVSGRVTKIELPNNNLS